jgi:putative MATE family efflux protein
MLCSVVVSVLATLIVMTFPEVVLSLFTKDTEVIRISASYLRIVCFSYIPTSITFCFASTLRSTGQSKLPMIASAVALSVNTVLNYIFIFGKLGMPAMGARGAAVATVIARFAEAILILGVVYSLKLTPAASFRELFAFSRDFAVRFFQVVIPVIMNEVLWSTGVTMYTVVYGRMGTNILASINIASAIEGISFVLFRSMSNACADKAMERKTGARGLRAIMEEIMLDVMYDIPSKRNVEKCIIDKETVMSGNPPTLTFNETKKAISPAKKKKHSENINSAS